MAEKYLREYSVPWSDARVTIAVCVHHPIDSMQLGYLIDGVASSLRYEARLMHEQKSTGFKQLHVEDD